MKKKLTDLTKDERSLLLFLETRAVDYGGRVNGVHMNSDDFDIAGRWDAEGFIEFGRIVIQDHNHNGTNFVKLSASAMRLAQEERRARAKRMWENRTYKTTREASSVL